MLQSKLYLEYQLNVFNDVMEWFNEIWDFSPSGCALSHFAWFDKEAISRNTRGRLLEVLYLQPGSPVFPSPTSGLSKGNLERGNGARPRPSDIMCRLQGCSEVLLLRGTRTENIPDLWHIVGKVYMASYGTLGKSVAEAAINPAVCGDG